jgi:hypothetical protein
MADPRQNPFPGMNPHLESRWAGVHNALVTYLRDALEDVLPPDLQPQLDERVFIELVEEPARYVRPDVYVHEPPSAFAGTRSPGSNGAVAAAEPLLIELPEAEVKETAIRIVDARSGGRLVTAIEIVSPSNKAAGPGRKLYRRKQRAARRGRANLVEVDLLRGGTPVTLARPSAIRPAHRSSYHAVVHRATHPGRIEYYPIHLR